MFDIFLTKEAMSAMTVEERYLIVQATRIDNMAKIFLALSLKTKPVAENDEVAARSNFELLFHHAASLFEIIEALSGNLGKLFLKHLKGTDVRNEIVELVNGFRRKERVTIEVGG